MDFRPVVNEKIIRTVQLGGGDIGKSYKVTTDRSVFFIKYYGLSGVSVKEAHGLEAIADTGALRVPSVVSYDDHFLVLEFIDSGPKQPDFQRLLGQGLARMHKKAFSRFGFFEDNYIGTTVQKNTVCDSWVDFFTENRLEYQVNLAADRGISETWKRLKPLVPGIIGCSAEHPCIIHGDLWGGNVISGASGEPVLIDPAAYYGHREMDLGMTMLFGGFSPDFYKAYNEEYPLAAGWKERMNLYMLYHVLNHCNMFGGGYRHQAIGLMNGYLK